MTLMYKPDWAEAQQHFAAWWRGKSLGRPALAVCAPRANPLPFPPLVPRPNDTPKAHCLGCGTVSG